MAQQQVEPQVEPWLRGTHTDVDPVVRAVLHALELAHEDVVRWCGPLGTGAREAAPLGLPSPAFQLRHLARSLDRLMTYAEGASLNQAQLLALREEKLLTADPLAEFEAAIAHAKQRLLRFRREQFAEPRYVGRSMLPATVAGLLVHIADHTQRHVGQAITTAKVVLALHGAESS